MESIILSHNWTQLSVKHALFLLDAAVGHHYIPPHFAGTGGRLSSLNAVLDAITELEI